MVEVDFTSFACRWKQAIYNVAQARGSDNMLMLKPRQSRTREAGISPAWIAPAASGKRLQMTAVTDTRLMDFLHATESLQQQTHALVDLHSSDCSARLH